MLCQENVRCSGLYPPRCTHNGGSHNRSAHNGGTDNGDLPYNNLQCNHGQSVVWDDVTIANNWDIHGQIGDNSGQLGRLGERSPVANEDAEIWFMG